MTDHYFWTTPKGWHDALGNRPAIIHADERAETINTMPTITTASKALLFGAVRPTAQ